MIDKRFFPVSVWYGANRARAPMILPIKKEDTKKIKEDMLTIQKAGFNTIRFWYDWFTAEPRPDTWHFDEMETLMGIADEVGIKVNVQVYTDSAPNWVENDYPDSLFVDRSGLKIHSQASPGYCSDHPEVRAHITEYLKGLAKVVSSHESFFGWDIWSEPHIVQWSWVDYMKDPWFCFCENSQKRFRDWLQKKYSSIEELNSAWYRTHRSWEEVIAPRYISLSTFADVIDWLEFNKDKIVEDLDWKTRSIKEVDKEHIVSSHAAISCVYGIPGVGYGSSDDWKLADKVDAWGTSFYPKHTGPWMPLKPHQMGVALDASRSSAESKNKPFWIGELQTGDGVTGLKFGVPVIDKDVDRWAWLAISRNAKCLNYYAWFPMSCGYEVSGFGLSEPDGSVNERVTAAGKVSKIVTENMETFRDAKTLPAKVAILFNVKAHMALPCLRGLSADVIRKDMFGFYKAMMKKHIPVDFIHLEDLETRDLSKYDVIFAAFSITLEEIHGEALERYVRNGGNLIADGRIGWMDSKGDLSLTIPGAGLAKVFGCYEDYMTEVKDPKVITTENGREINAHSYLVTFNPTTAETIGSCDGKPVITKNSYEKGTAVMIGTMSGRSVEENSELSAENFLLDLVEEAGIKPYFEVETCNPLMEVKISSSTDCALAFIFNHSEEVAIASLKIPDSTISEPEEIIDLKENRAVAFNKNGKDTEIPLEVGIRDTKVLLIKYH